MTDHGTVRAQSSHLPFVLTLVVLIVVGLIAYFAVASRSDSKRVKLALVTWNQDAFWDPVIKGAQDAGREFNVDVTIVKSKPELEAQNADIRNLIAQGIQGIGLSPNDPKQQTELLREAAGKCPVVMFDVDAPESQRRVFVGIDNYSAGHFAADALREALPEGGQVIITVGSTEMPHGRERRQGVIDGLLDRHYRLDHAFDPLDTMLVGEKYSVVGTIIDNGDPARSSALLAEALRAHPDVKGVVALFSYSAAAALQAIEQAGKKGQIKVVAFDDSEEVQTGIENGTIAASILQDTYRMGNETIRLLASEVRSPGAQTPSGERRVLVQIDVIRQDNLQTLRKDGRVRPVKTQSATPTTQPQG